MKKINMIRGLESVNDYYFITTCGKVISIRDGKINILKGNLTKSGYEQVTLRVKGNINKRLYIHRLVALAYLQNIKNNLEVNHKNEIKTDNYVQNLEWMTKKENINYGTRNKRASDILKGRVLTEVTKQKMSKAKKGERNPNANSKEYYVTNPITRSNFKRVCKSMNWEFRHFKEIDSGEKHETNKKYFYIYIGEDNKDYGVQINEKEYYETHSAQRHHFKIACKRQNWNFDEFEEVYSGEKCGTNKKYYYVYKYKNNI